MRVYCCLYVLMHTTLSEQHARIVYFAVQTNIPEIIELSCDEYNQFKYSHTLHSFRGSIFTYLLCMSKLFLYLLI